MPIATESEKLSLNLQAEAALRCYAVTGASYQDKAAWVDICCHGPWVRKLLKGEFAAVSQLPARMTIAASCARVFGRVLQGGEAPILTAEMAVGLRDAACTLRQGIAGSPYIPAAASGRAFAQGLDALCAFTRTDAPIPTSKHAGPWRRWATFEFARDLLRAFDRAPSPLIAELLGILWGGVDESWVRKRLPEDIISQLRIGLVEESRLRIAEDITALKTQGIMNAITRTCSAEKRLQAEVSLARAQRLLAGDTPYDSDQEAVNAALQALNYVSDEQVAADLKNSLQEAAASHGLD